VRSSGKNRSALLLAPALLLATIPVGCSDNPYVGTEKNNLAPEVWLSAAPPEGSSSIYLIHLWWGGWDPDGEIAYYEYAITENETGIFDPADTVGADNWHRVYAHDSTFVFAADQLADSSTSSPVARFERSHTFLIRAVDTKGLASEEPAHRSFTAWTLSPSVRILVPRRKAFNPAQVPAITTFKWVATDYVDTESLKQEPDSVRWILKRVSGVDYSGAIQYVRKNPNAPEWSDWRYYRAPGDSGKSWTTPPTDFGSYIFAVQAKDEAGAVTPVFDEVNNVRRVVFSRRTTGPLLTVSNEYIGSVLTLSQNTPTTIIDLPAGVWIQFSWTANADEYGGYVSGYRYGWDIADLSKDEQWEVDFTPFVGSVATSPPRRFYFGSHTFNVEVMDNSNGKSRVEVKVNIIQFTMHKNLLLVDDFYENPLGSGFEATKGALPNDEEHDAFWRDVLRRVDGFDSSADVISVHGGTFFPITRLAEYKTMIWDVFGGYGLTSSAKPLLANLIEFRSEDPEKSTSGGAKVQPNLLALFMAAGGRLLLCGEQPLVQVINPRFFDDPAKFPIIFKYELEGGQTGKYGDQVDSRQFVGDKSFGYQEACVNVFDLAYSSYTQLRRQIDHGCGVTAIRTVSAVNDGLRECVPIDPSFPSLTLRPEVTAAGMHYAPDRRGLKSELYNPPYFSFCAYAEYNNPRGCFQPIYAHSCLDASSVVYGAPVAFWSTTYANTIPESGGTPARSAFFGFEPVFFNPDEVRVAIERVLFDEWRLPRKQ